MTSERTVFKRMAMVLVLILAVFEVAARFLIPRISEIESRITSDLRGVQAAAAVPPAQGQRIWVVGNSLLVQSVSFPELQSRLPAGVRVLPVRVEDTRFLDWIYGLHRLLLQAPRPDKIILMLSPEQLASSRIRGDYSAYRMFTSGDTLRVGARLGLSRTGMADLLAANLSAFRGQRNEIRQQVYRAVAPWYRELLHELGTARGMAVAEPPAHDVLRTRFIELHELCAKFSVECLYAPPPAPGAQQEVRVAVSIAESVHVPVGPLFLDRSWPADLFGSDMFHMSDGGQHVFTPLFGAAVVDLLHEGVRSDGSRPLQQRPPPPGHRVL